ncbi:MAG: dTMP kinase [Candidatus Omnitrophota bacterium]
MAKKNIVKANHLKRTMPKQKKAVFITVEGGEGCGKSSIINFLFKLFKANNLSVKIFREPGSTRIGEKIRDLLLDKKNNEMSVYTELLLYLAARTQLIEEKLRKALYQYDILICDRFYDSTLVYQGYALGLGKIAEDSVKVFSLGIVPDITFILDTLPRSGLKRIECKDRIELRPVSFHDKLRMGYIALSKRYPQRIKLINANGTLQDTYKNVEKIVIEEIIK